MIRLWHRLRAASSADRALAAEALSLLIAARLGLWCLPFATARGLLSRYARRPRSATVPPTRVAWAVAAVARRLPAPFRDCLPQALAAEALLRRHGGSPELHLGVRQAAAPRGIEAHAWVTSGDQVVVGSLEDLPTYQPMTPGGWPHGPVPAVPATSMSRDGLATLFRGPVPTWDRLGCDPPAFLDLCRAEETSALVFHRTRNAPAFASWPTVVRDALAGDAQAAVAREMLVQRELLRVLAALAAKGVQPILFKGTALAYSVYPHPGLRSRSDTDLLIRQADAAAVQEALVPLGYAPSLLCGGELLFRQFELARDDEFGVSHALDFHWAISTQAAFATALSVDELVARAVPAPALGPHALVPSALDALLLALIHPAMHHRNAWRLLWACDVHLLASALDQDGLSALVREATARRVAAVCAHGLQQARGWFGTSIPQPVIDQLAAAPVNEEPTASYLTPSRSWAAETAANLRGLARWRDRLRLLREIAFPSPAYLLRSYGMGGSAAGQAFLPALYFHRGVRGIWRVMRGAK